MTKRIIITGGGSGGHVSVAQGIIDTLIKEDPSIKDNLLYVGGKLVSESYGKGKSIEQLRFENSDIPFIAINGGKLQRSFSINSIKLLFGFILGLRDAWRIITKFKPDIIFSTGGFVSLPVCLVGNFKKIPIYLHEQTSAIGLTNQIVGKFATKIFITFPQSAQFFPEGKTKHTGNIVRECTFIVNEKNEIGEAINKMLPKKSTLPIIYISGGGQGAHFLNIIIRQMLQYLLLDYQIIHQIGDNGINRDYDVLLAEKNKLPKGLIDRYFPVKYVNEQEIGNVFSKCDIYMGRSGANTVYEVGLHQKPSILIPIPWVTHNEQYKNAEILVKCGIGKIVPEGTITAEQLYQTLKAYKIEFFDGKYSGDKDMLQNTFTKNAAEAIVKEILN
jgi:UDP-N-acetylglucosamine--N-acetylmuramyl-(pentapeptide) pyrophosphoryl-undecaprenol N-acetylglucosamine transferase